jgi:hypothetical protein
MTTPVVAKAAIAESVREVLGDGAEQLALLPSLDGIERGEEIAAAVEKRSRGRPKGASSLAQRDVVEFIRKTIGDPLVDSARYLLLAPAELAKVLKCTTAEAYDRQQRVREFLARFMYAPKAPIDDQGNAVVPRLTMVLGGQHAHLGDVAPGARPPWEYLEAQSEQNQPLIEAAPAQSHGEPSHGDDKSSDNSSLDDQTR